MFEAVYDDGDAEGEDKGSECIWGCPMADSTCLLDSEHGAVQVVTVTVLGVADSEFELESDSLYAKRDLLLTQGPYF